MHAPYLLAQIYVDRRLPAIYCTTRKCEKHNYGSDLTSPASTCHTDTTTSSTATSSILRRFLQRDQVTNSKSQRRCSLCLIIDWFQPKMKSFMLLLIALSSVAAFAPHPTIQHGLPSIRQMNSVRFMSGQNTLEQESVETSDQEIGLKKEEPVADASVVEVEEDMSKTQKLLKKVKDAGKVGFISYAARFMSGQNKESVETSDQELGLKKEEPVADEAVVEVEEEMSETQKLLKKVKDAGKAGVISYAAWELAFWALSVPVCIAGYRSVTGHFPDFSNKEDLAQLGAEAFAFVNFARFAVPLRIGLALSTTQWVQENVVDRFTKKEEGEESESA
jgi:hypothetical protein